MPAYIKKVRPKTRLDTQITIGMTKEHKIKLLNQYDEWCVKNGYFEPTTKPSFSLWLTYDRLKLSYPPTDFMLLPIDRKQAILKETRQLLSEFTIPKVQPWNKLTTKELRLRAEEIMRAFPTDEQIDQIFKE